MRVWIIFWLVLLVPRTAATSFAEQPWPDLSEDALAQIATAVDGERPDEPALYPLLLNMRQWTQEDFTRSGVAILADGLGHVFDRPEESRGAGPFELSGRFAGRVREVELLRGGPWGRTVTEWGLVADGPKDAAGRVAVVYFPGAVDRPRDRQRVRVAARFFKLWTDVDAAGMETTYPVFVAAPFWEPVGGVGAVPWRGMVLVVVVMMAGLWWARRGVRRAKSEKRTGLVRPAGRMEKARVADDDGVEEPLPEDAAEALGVLRDRGGGVADGSPPPRG